MHIAANHAFTDITGYSIDEAVGKNPRILGSGRTTPDFYQTMWATLNATDKWRGELLDRRKDGGLYYKSLSIKAVRDGKGNLINYVGVFSDISERKAAEDRMQHLANHDALTGLPNRILFSDRLKQALVRARRDKSRLALMFLDLDKFKPINDSYGHAVGDLVLGEVARRLVECVRESDTVARLGGDEFLVLLPDLGALENYKRVGDKILNVLNQPFELAGHNLMISASIGISVYPEHGDDEHQLVQNADIAMYQAKGKQGCNIVMAFPTSSQVNGKQSRVLTS